MKYVALLRGINVGGNNKVDMKKLKLVFEKLGHENVITYINSGNIVFESTLNNESAIVTEIEKGIEKEFGVSIRVIIRTKSNIDLVVSKIKPTWQNDSEQRTDILFLWDEVDNEEVLQRIIINEVDVVQYIDGAVIWHFLRKDYNKSGMSVFAKNSLYKQVTVRNCNTVRKLNELLE